MRDYDVGFPLARLTVLYVGLVMLTITQSGRHLLQNFGRFCLFQRSRGAHETNNNQYQWVWLRATPITLWKNSL